MKDKLGFNQHFGRMPLQVTTLTVKERAAIVSHFLQLDNNDRYLRFGAHLIDAHIERYVNQLNFERDLVFGVFNQQVALVGVGHLAPLTNPYVQFGSTKRERMGELGISVHEVVRGMGVGTALFTHAVTHSRNRHYAYLYMHCLAHNQGIMAIARKQKMKLEFEFGEADAYLALPPPNLSSVMQEAVKTQSGELDYGVKRMMQLREKWFSGFTKK